MIAFFILFYRGKIQYQIDILRKEVFKNMKTSKLVMFDKPIDPDRLVSVKIGGCTVTFQ